ncbi:MAG: hypothetical protein ACTSU9_17705 [Promethearchaeota archaeon]
MPVSCSKAGRGTVACQAPGSRGWFGLVRSGSVWFGLVRSRVIARAFPVT